jgi:nucleoside-diphosphate-sugar epimerase
MKAYLTGATGSLGTGIRKYFKKHEIISGIANILDKNYLEEEIKNSECDAIIHTAAIVGSSSCEAYGKEFSYKVNVEGTQNIVDISKKFKLKLVHFGSTAIYGSRIYEDDILTENSSSATNTIYSHTKYWSEKAVIETLPLEQWMIIRPTMIYHSNDSFTNQKSLNYTIQSIFNREPQLVLNLDPSSYKCYTHIKDFCRILEGLINNNCWGEDFNISCGVDKKEKTRHIFDYITEKLNETSDTKIVFRPDKDTLKNHVVSCKKAINYSHVVPEYSLKKGIDEMIEFYKKKAKR